MTGPLTTSALKDLLKFPFQSPDWQNRFLIGTALTFGGFIIPVIPLLFVYGYAIEIMRRTANGEPLEMPAWTDWGRLILDGLKSFLVGFLFTLPGYLVMIVGFVIYFGTIFGTILSEAASQRYTSSNSFPPFIFLAMLVLYVSMALAILLINAGAIPLPAALAHMAVKNHFGAAFHFREWGPRLTHNKLGYLSAFIILSGLFVIWYTVFMVAYMSLIFCFLIPFLTAPSIFYLVCVGAALFGQTYHEGGESIA